MRLVDEVEAEPAVSITLMNIPGVEAQTFAVDESTLPDLDASPDDWVDLVFGNQASSGGGKHKASHVSSIVLFAEPGSSKTGFVSKLLAGLDFAFPNAAKVGGEASQTPPSKGRMICRPT